MSLAQNVLNDNLSYLKDVFIFRYAGKFSCTHVTLINKYLILLQRYIIITLTIRVVIKARHVRAPVQMS